MRPVAEAKRALAGASAFAVAMLPCPAIAYEGAIHQQLTFIAAREFNRCVADANLVRLTPLEVRYVAKANARQADRAWWRRIFRWNYYDRSEHSAGRFLWLWETRMHASYRDAIERLEEARDLSRRFTNLGRIVNFLQDATTPSYVTPVFSTRLWRFSIGDRFNKFPLDPAALDAALGGDCAGARGAGGAFETLLQGTAARTIASIREPIAGLPTTWEAFWEFDKDADDFGSYGPAGNNFGRQTTFECTSDETRDCVLLAGDPLYAAYANARHAEAVRATVSALVLMQEHLRRAVDAPAPPASP